MAGRYGGTYARTDIAFEFASWISVEFKLYLVKEFQRLKEEEQKLLNRIETLKETLSPKQQVHLTLITTFGLVQGKHSGKVQKVVTCDELFT